MRSASPTSSEIASCRVGRGEHWPRCPSCEATGQRLRSAGGSREKRSLAARIRCRRFCLGPTQGFVPLFDLKAAHNAVEHEWIPFHKLLSSLASRKDGHRAGEVGEGPDHEELPAIAELPPPRLMLGEMNGRLLAHVVRGFVRDHVPLAHRASFSPRYKVCLPSNSQAGGKARYARTSRGC